ncbi:MAG: transporter substrate-binding domain-containing protein, partial [Roseinatronobacter sp.]|nr:transporter substrate-binding domain-containing protein [Roseinatronobacter sp.]
DRLGVSLDVIRVSAAHRLPTLEQGVVDLVIATMGDTTERRAISDMIQPHYYSSGVALFARPDFPYGDWGQLRGRSVCLTEGAYFNRALQERYLVDGLVFPSNGTALLALTDGRCVGWAFDDTAISQLVLSGEHPQREQVLPVILTTPWAIAVAKTEGEAPWGRFVADVVAHWHVSGFLLERQAAWGLPESTFLKDVQRVWSQRSADGAMLCRRGADGLFPAACLINDVARIGLEPVVLPDWANRLEARTWLDLQVLFDAFARAKLAQGIWMTLALSGVALLGALLVGIVLGLADRAAARIWVIRGPIRALLTIARMTPPILQLYIVFFGIGAILANSYAITPGAFLVASVIFSFYAGATNAVLISSALQIEQAIFPEARLITRLPAAMLRAFDGLVATCVNIVKAAGMASAIALTEIIATVNTLIGEGASAAILMNVLLVFYFFFVMAVVWAFRGTRLLIMVRR